MRFRRTLAAAAAGTIIMSGAFALPAMAEDAPDEPVVVETTEPVVESAPAPAPVEQTDTSNDVATEPVVENPAPVPEPEPAPAVEPQAVVPVPEPEPSSNDPPAEQPLMRSAAVQTQSVGGGGGQDVCPSTGGWTKIDGVNAKTKTITAPNGFLISDVCYKASTTRVGPTTLDTPVASYTFTSTVTNWKGNIQDISHVAYRLVPVPEQFVTVLWRMDNLPGTTSGIGWPQTYVDHEVTSTPNLGFFDAQLTGECVGYQVDVYKYTTAADKAKVDHLLDVKHLLGADNPPEPLIPGGAGTAWKTYVNLDCAPPPPTNIQCETYENGPVATNLDAAGWNMAYVPNGESKPGGSWEFVDNGVQLTNADGNSKVSWKRAVDIPLYMTGQISIDWTVVSGGSLPYGPGANLFVDFDNNPATGNMGGFTGADGTLVFEPNAPGYGQIGWLTGGSAQFVKDGAPHVAGGGGYPNQGLVNDWLVSFPTAQVKGIAFAFGTGGPSVGVLHSLTIGCKAYTFDYQQPPPPPTKDPTFTEWVDGEWECDDTTVEQTRTRTDYAAPVWDPESKTWVEDAVGTTTTETRTRDLTEEEQFACTTYNPVGSIAELQCLEDGAYLLIDIDNSESTGDIWVDFIRNGERIDYGMVEAGEVAEDLIFPIVGFDPVDVNIKWASSEDGPWYDLIKVDGYEVDCAPPPLEVTPPSPTVSHEAKVCDTTNYTVKTTRGWIIVPAIENVDGVEALLDGKVVAFGKHEVAPGTHTVEYRLIDENDGSVELIGQTKFTLEVKAAANPVCEKPDRPTPNNVHGDVSQLNPSGSGDSYVYGVLGAIAAMITAASAVVFVRRFTQRRGAQG